MDDVRQAARYRKMSVVIEAIKWSGLEADLPAVFAFIGDFKNLPDDGALVGGPGVGYVPPSGSLFIPTKEGTMEASPGDFIIKGVKGEFYPCKPDIFALTYEPESGAKRDAEQPAPDVTEEMVQAALKIFVCTEKIMFRVDPSSMRLALVAALSAKGGE